MIALYLLCTMIRLLVFGLFCFLTACQKNTVTSWNTRLWIPLINGEVSLMDIAGDSLTTVDPTGVVHFILERDLLNLKLNESISIPDTTLNLNYKVIFPITLNPGQNIPIGNSNPMTFKPDHGIQLKFVKIRRGQLNVRFKNSVSQALDVDFLVPDARGQQGLLRIQETVPSGNQWHTKTYQLEGYTLSLQPFPNTYNTLRQQLTVRLNAAAPVTSVESGQGIDIELSYQELVPDYVQGYFGSFTESFRETQSNWWDQNIIKSPNLKFQEASASFSVINAAGLDFKFQLDTLIGHNAYANHLTLHAPYLNNLNISRAQEHENTPTPTLKTFTINSSNSNIHQFISLLPYRIDAAAKAQLNPLGNTSGFNDFIYYNQGLQIRTRMDLPLRFSYDYILAEKTLTLSSESVQNLKTLNSAELQIETENQFPFQTQFQVYLLNSTGSITDSLFSAGPKTVSEASEYKGNVAKHSETLLLTSDLLNQLRQHPVLQFKIKLTGIKPNAEQTLFDYQTLKFKLHVKANTRMEVD